MTTYRLKTALLGSGAAIALMAASAPVAADEIDALRAQINALQDKVSQIETDAIATPRVAPAAAVEAGSKPKSWVLPGSNTSMNIGGYVKLDFIYDLNAFFGDSTGDPQGANTPGANRQGNFRLHARQSRVWFKTWTPTDWGELATHIEGDFFGAGGNEIISNSTPLRLRHAYGRLGPVLAGQTWTNWMDLGALPDIVDFAGPPGLKFIRQGQLRYTHSFGGGTTLALSLENPEQSLGPLVATSSAAVAVGATKIDHAPDGVIRLNHRFSGGHVTASAVVRQLSAEAGGPNGFSDSVFAYAVSLGGSYSVTSGTKIKGEFTYGEGVGRYMIGSHLAPTIITGTTPGTAELNAIRAYGFSVSATHKWTDTLRSTIAGGFAFVDAEDEVSATALATAKGNIPAGTQDRQDQVHLNLIWSPVPQVNFGIEYVWSQVRDHNAPNGRGSRIHLGMQYKF